MRRRKTAAETQQRERCWTLIMQHRTQERCFTGNAAHLCTEPGYYSDPLRNRAALKQAYTCEHEPKSYMSEFHVDVEAQQLGCWEALRSSVLRRWQKVCRFGEKTTQANALEKGFSKRSREENMESSTSGSESFDIQRFSCVTRTGCPSGCVDVGDVGRRCRWMLAF